MLKVAAEHYLKTLNDKCFIPNPDYVEWVDVNCLDVIIKCRPKLSWQHNSYFYDHFGLNDLLDEPLPDISSYISKPVSLTPDFEWNTKHDVNGKIGAKIVSLFSLNVEGDNQVKVSLKFENLSKTSMDFSAVKKLLETRKINLSNPYLLNLAHGGRNVICLISQYITINKDTEISAVSLKSFDENANVDKTGVNVDDKGNVSYNKTKTIKFAAGTRIAFDLIECLIGTDGSITLLDHAESVSKGTKMIPKSPQKIIVPDDSDHTSKEHQKHETSDKSKENLKDVLLSLHALLDNKNRRRISKHLMKLKVSKPSILKSLNLFLVFCENLESGKSINLLDTNQFSLDTMKNLDLKEILSMLNVDLNPKSVTDVTKLDIPLVKSVSVLVEAVLELDTFLVNNILKITEKSFDNSIENLIILMQSSKYFQYVDKLFYQKTTSKCKLCESVLLSAGITSESCFMTNEWGSIFILLNTFLSGEN